MSDVKVSIICITYNHANYIRQTLDSFLMQKTNFKYEILIHDDASTDDTANIVREYEGKYPEIIKPIYQIENQYSKGAPIIAGVLLPKAKGEYVAFCEGDDFWTDENKLQKQIDFLDKNSEYSACVHKFITVDKSGKQTNMQTFGYYEQAGRYTLKDFETNQLPSQLASLVCRNLFYKEETKYPAEFIKNRVQGDVKYFLYLLAHGDIYRMDECYSAYRCVLESGGGSWTSRQLTDYKMPYIRWKHLSILERDFYKEYGKKVSLKQRKIRNANIVLAVFKRKPNFKTFVNALKVIILQRGLLVGWIKKLFYSLRGKS